MYRIKSLYDNKMNMQNIPSHNKEIRQMFKATDGYKLVSGDYSKQEVFIAASVSGDKNFIESCKNSLKNDTDIYSEIAAMIYDVPYEECIEFRADGTKNDAGKERRGNAKAIVLGEIKTPHVLVTVHENYVNLITQGCAA